MAPSKRLTWGVLAGLMIGVLGAGTLTGCRDTLVRLVLQEQDASEAPVRGDVQLVTASGAAYGVDQLEAALHRNGGPPVDTLITLVHGMGQYPEKAYRRGAFEILRHDHHADVLLFNWPSWIDFRTLPTENAKASGGRLREFLERLDAQVRSGEIAGTYEKRTLIVHSMGARVLESMLGEYEGGLSKDLFSSVLLVAAEVDLKGHAAWLERLDFAPRLYVLVNGRDRVLAAPETFYRRSRLGRSLTRADGVPELLARNAVYIMTDTGTRWHSFHLHRRSPDLGILLARLVAGEDLGSEPSLVATARPNVLIFRPVNGIDLDGVHATDGTDRSGPDDIQLCGAPCAGTSAAVQQHWGLPTSPAT